MVLTFGNPNKPTERYLYKTCIGGCLTLFLVFFILAYVATLFATIYSGEYINTTETLQADPALLGSLSLAEMKVMPVVTFTYINTDIYLDPTFSQVKDNIFVALL